MKCHVLFWCTSEFMLIYCWILDSGITFVVTIEATWWKCHEIFKMVTRLGVTESCTNWIWFAQTTQGKFKCVCGLQKVNSQMYTHWWPKYSTIFERVGSQENSKTIFHSIFHGHCYILFGHTSFDRLYGANTQYI